VVLTTPLLEGLDGVEKMSKSLGNYVGVTEPPAEMFGKIMSIPDVLMWRYYLLLTDLSEVEIGILRGQAERGERHPKDLKVELASRIVTDFHSAAAARQAAEAFDARFARGQLVIEELPQVVIQMPDGALSLSRLIAEAGLAVSASEAARKVQQGGVKVDREKATDPRARIDSNRLPVTLEVGRRAVRIVLPGPESA
jgi:tyrosyl-tRNA synthetase